MQAEGPYSGRLKPLTAANVRSAVPPLPSMGFAPPAKQHAAPPTFRERLLASVTTPRPSSAAGAKAPAIAPSQRWCKDVRSADAYASSRSHCGWGWSSRLKRHARGNGDILFCASHHHSPFHQGAALDVSVTTTWRCRLRELKKYDGESDATLDCPWLATPLEDNLVRPR